MGHLLKPTGTLGVIVSNRFMTTRGGATVRAALRSRLSLLHVWDLGDTKLFDAAVLPAVILAAGHNRQHGNGIGFSSIYEVDGEPSATAVNPIAALARQGTVELEDRRRFRVQHGTLDCKGPSNGIWRMATEAGDAWLDSVLSRRWGTFRDIGKIRVGVKTCADSIFIRSDWDKLDQARPELLRPLTTHHIARRFKPLGSDKPSEILYPHEVVQGQRQSIDIAQYPNALAYLKKHRALLESRTYVIEAGRKWYEIWVPQDPAAWIAPKLVFRDISDRPIFWLDLHGTVVNGDCYWLTPNRADQEPLLWLAAAVANSTFAEAFYDHRFNNKLYSGRRRFITQYVEHFPLPDPSTRLSQEIGSLARTIYGSTDSKPTDALQAMLNEMVWKAFGLVEEPSR